jgi:heptosyltransferase-1
MGSLRAELRRKPYDLILDLQGLLKSALWARQAIGPVAGYDRPVRANRRRRWFYQRTAAVSRGPACGGALPPTGGGPPGLCPADTPPDFGLQAPRPTDLEGPRLVMRC